MTIVGNNPKEPVPNGQQRHPGSRRHSTQAAMILSILVFENLKLFRVDGIPLLRVEFEMCAKSIEKH